MSNGEHEVRLDGIDKKLDDIRREIRDEFRNTREEHRLSQTKLETVLEQNAETKAEIRWLKWGVRFAVAIGLVALGIPTVPGVI